VEYIWSPRVTFATLVLIYIIACTLVGLYGRNRVLGFWGFFALSYVFSPFLMFLFLAVTDTRRG
jgi:hypothetical protein